MGHASHPPDAHGHDAPPAPEPPPRLPPHVFTIARVTTWIGLLLLASGSLAALWYAWSGPRVCAAWSALAAVYGFCIWLAAREKLSLEYRGAAAP